MSICVSCLAPIRQAYCRCRWFQAVNGTTVDPMEKARTGKPMRLLVNAVTLIMILFPGWGQCLSVSLSFGKLLSMEVWWLMRYISVFDGYKPNMFGVFEISVLNLETVYLGTSLLAYRKIGC